MGIKVLFIVKGIAGAEPLGALPFRGTSTWSTAKEACAWQLLE
jgi:hypothetical protein